MAARWAVVTGGGGGIGVAVSLQLASQGFGVLMLDLQEGALHAGAERVRKAGGTAETMVLDALSPTAPAAALACAEALGRVDALVNLAGGSGQKPIRTIEEMEDALWDHILALNVTSAFRFCRAFVPGMRARRHGRIVNISSTLARGRKGPVTTHGARLAYSTAKAALLGLTAQLAKDEAAHGITVNAVMPSLILAEQGSRIRDRFEALPPEQKAGMLRDFPTGRAGEAHEVAAVIGFLCSDAASYVTGTGMPVDGGFL
jgi:NAD(P)-dependent dehydrogenase (short-subunit alcohol dehydrogenase family)